MHLWKINLYRHGEISAVQYGVIVAPTREDAVKLAARALGNACADYANVDATEIEEITSLPEGTLYLRHSET